MGLRACRAALMAVILATAIGCVGAEADTDLSSKEMQGRWWTWAASEPLKTNPVADKDGGLCARNQPDDVWFLAGTFGGKVKRSCTVPDDLPIAFPLVNKIGTDEQCEAFMDVAEGSATLDGEDLVSDTYRGELVEVDGAASNPLTGKAGRLTDTACGLWVQIPPLEPGPHSLRIRGKAADFSVEVGYSLTVESSS